jgi:hypothetical protein
MASHTDDPNEGGDGGATIDASIRWEGGSSFEEVANSLLADGYRKYLEPRLSVEIDPDFDVHGDVPEWIRARVERHIELSAVAQILREGLGRDITARLHEADREFLKTLQHVTRAMGCKPNKETEECLEYLLRRVGWDYYQALMALLPIWKRENAGAVDKRRKLKDWLEELDKHPEWMEKKPNGSWKVTGNHIEKTLAHRGIKHPTAGQINRERNKRLKNS